MPVKKEPNGRRSVQAEVEVPGTPEEVWNAIASGPGVSSWFVPARIEEHVGGKVTTSFGPGMDSIATIDEWQPPHRFVADNRDEAGPNNPAVATEWTVEARGGGTCVVRVVHSWFADSDDWDNQFEGHSHGWVAFFRSLRLYLTHFRGQHAQCLQLMAASPKPSGEAFRTLTDALGIGAPEPGQRVTTRNAPSLAGRVEHVGPAQYPELSLLLDAPAPGIGHFFVLPMGKQTFVIVRFYLFGKQDHQGDGETGNPKHLPASPPSCDPQLQSAWQSFMQATFPS